MVVAAAKLSGATMVSRAAALFWMNGVVPASWIGLPPTVKPFVAEPSWMSWFSTNGLAMFWVVMVWTVPARKTTLPGFDWGKTSQFPGAFQLPLPAPPDHMEVVWAGADPATAAARRAAMTTGRRYRILMEEILKSRGQ